MVKQFDHCQNDAACAPLRRPKERLIKVQKAFTRALDKHGRDLFNASLKRLRTADVSFHCLNLLSTKANSEAFYRNRKRFGGGDKERIVWFFSESLAKRGQNIDVYFSKPMNLDEIYNTLSQEFGHSQETLKADPHLAAELMRQFTYQVSETFPQDLDAKISPRPVR